MSGRTGTEVVQVKSSTGTGLWYIDPQGHGWVDVVTQPALAPGTDGVHLGGSSGNTVVDVTANNSLAVAASISGSVDVGNVTVVFGANTWQINSTGAGPVVLQGRNGTDVIITSGGRVNVHHPGNVVVQPSAGTTWAGVQRAGDVYSVDGNVTVSGTVTISNDPLAVTHSGAWSATVSQGAAGGSAWPVSVDDGQVSVLAGNISVVDGGTFLEINTDGQAEVVVNKNFVTFVLTNLNVAFDGSPSSTVTGGQDCEDYTYFTFQGELTKVNAPTDIVFEVQFSPDGGTTWHPYHNWFWGDLRWDDTSVGSDGLKFALTGKCAAPLIRLFGTVTGTATSNTHFTGNDMYLTLKT